MTAFLTVTMNPAIDLSALTDRVEPERKLRCRDIRHDPGGGGINVARVLKRLGAEVRALYPAGGSPGERLHRMLDAEGVESLPVPVAGETRENFTVLETTTDDQYRFVLPGPELAADEVEACVERLAEEPAPALLIVSGALPSGMPGDFFSRVAGIARAAGARLVADTSGPALAAALEAGVYLVKPNLRELSDLAGRPLERESDWLPAAAELVETGGAEVVALTLGHAGALLVTRDCRLFAPPIPVRPVSAVGAGDSFLAGLVWRLNATGDLSDAFRYGVAAGTAALLTPGSELCRPEDVEEIYREVRVQDVRSRAPI